MVTILYSGPPLDTATVLQMAHDAAGGHPETRLELRQCCTREQLAQALEEAAGQVGRGEERRGPHGWAGVGQPDPAGIHIAAAEAADRRRPVLSGAPLRVYQ